VLEYPFVATAIGGRVLQQFPPGAPGLLVEHATGGLMPRISITSIEAMREIVRRTDGVGLCTRMQIADELRHNRLVVLDVDFAVPGTGYGIAWLRDRTLSPAARSFVATIQAVEAAIEDSGEMAAPARRRRAKQAHRKV
jgi:DNA-binding transcriptional LysR family regulator